MAGRMANKPGAKPTIPAVAISHGEFADTIEALSEGDLNPSGMISSIIPIEECEQAFEKLVKNPENNLKFMLKISD